MNSLPGFLRHALRHPYALMPGSPHGIINSARDWVREHQGAEPAAACWEVDAPAPRSLAAPHGELAAGLHVQRHFNIPATALFQIKGARVLGSGGVVISPDNRVFAEFTYADTPGGGGSHSVFRRRRFPRPQPLRGTYATLCYPSSSAYFHWVIESLPRIRLLRDRLDSLAGIFVPEAMEPAMRESLSIFGIDEKRCIPMCMNSHFAPDCLLVPAYCAGLDVPVWVPQFLRETVLGKSSSPHARRRIYISRSDAGKRRVTNEAAIASLLKSRGFEIVRLRELGFRAQAELLASAHTVVGPHGAGLANLAFCRPGTQVLELLPSPRVAPHLFYSLADAAGAQYWFLAGQPAQASGLRGDDDVDFAVDADKLAARLDEMAVNEVAGVPA